MLLFISDSHLGIGTSQAQTERIEKLFACLDHYRGNLERLYIIGDLFDFWFEWRHVILKRYFRVLCKLRGLIDQGIEVHYLAGNHDFALGQFLQDEIGAEIHQDAFQFEFNGKKFYLLHGDGLAPDDWGYRFLKRIFRNRLNQKLFTFIHPDYGLTLAHTSSHTSRNHTMRRWDVDGWAYRAEAERLIRRGSDYVLFGHTHEPLLMGLDSGIYVNTGDWMRYFSYATYENGNMKLMYWDHPGLYRNESEVRNCAVAK
ncbi:MAG: UDP-2,3-diacylglucosamine diphosphatase [bacterium]|nr:UDP-2,3-diacylglucosamine diphosphatase [bacterium]